VLDNLHSVDYSKFTLEVNEVTALEISYRTKKLERACTKLSVARADYGDRMAEKIHLRIDQIQAADTVEDLVKYSVGDCHPLKGDRAGQFAMALVQPHRLVFNKDSSNTLCVRIIDIEDYH